MDVGFYLDKMNDVDAIFKGEGAIVNSAEYRLLHEVSLDRAKRISDLSSNRKVTVQSVGRVCASLANRGLITVQTDRKDKRAKLVALTRKGRGAEQRYRNMIEKVLHG